MLIMFKLDFTVHLARNSQTHLTGLFQLSAFSCSMIKNCTVCFKLVIKTGSLFLSMPMMCLNEETGTTGTPGGIMISMQPLQRCSPNSAESQRSIHTTATHWCHWHGSSTRMRRTVTAPAARPSRRRLTNSVSQHQILSSYDWITPSYLIRFNEKLAVPFPGVPEQKLPEQYPKCKCQ